jgi:glycosyltransferase involved in cell wall biosynthesis
MLNYEFPPIGGGASPVTAALSRELVKFGNEVDVVTMGFKGLKPRENIDGVNVYRIPVMRMRQDICHTHEMLSFDLAALPFCLALVKKRKYHINHTHFIIPTGIISYCLKKLTGLPYIVTCHGSDIEGYNPDRFMNLHRLLRPLWNILARGPSYLTSPSGGLKDLIMKRDQRLKVRVIPNGLYLSEINLHSKKNNILLVSRLFERKGFQYFLEAIKDIEFHGEINIIGDGPYRARLEKMARDIKKNIRFWGYIDSSSPEYRSLYATSSIFVFPSKIESFGIVLAEAMAYGLAVITTSINSLKEVGGDACLYVRTENTGDIRLALEKLINDRTLREDMQRRAIGRAKNFTWPKIIEQFLSLYREVLNK